MSTKPNATSALPEALSPQDRWLTRSLCALTLLLLLTLALPMLRGQVYRANDLLSTHLPVRAFVHACYAEGLSPLWFPGYYCGFYLHGSGEAVLTHPLGQILYRTLPLTVAFNLELLLAYIAALTGTGILLRRWQLGMPYALFGAFSFAFSGWMLLRMVHMPVVLVLAHMPWNLLCIQHLVSAKSSRGKHVALAFLALLTGSQILLGNPQFILYSIAVEVAFTLYLLLSSSRLWRWLPLLLAAKCLGLAIGMAQVLPMYQSSLSSDREAPTMAFRLSYSLHPANLLQPVAPYLFRDRNVPEYTPEFGWVGNAHESTAYANALLGALLLWLLWRIRHLPSDRRRLAIASLILLCIGLLLALGRYGGVYYLQTILPMIGKFRVPSRYLVLCHFAASVAGALALEDLIRASRGERIGWRELLPLWIPAVVSLLLTGGAVVLRTQETLPWTHHIKPDTLRNNILIAYGPCAMLSAGFLLTLLARRVRFAPLLLALFLFLDVGLYGLSYGWSPAPASIEEIRAEYPAPPETRFRIESVRLIDNLWTLHGARLLHGYVQLDPNRELQYRDGSQNTFRVAGTAYWQDPATRPAEDEGHGPPPAPVWIRVPDPLPRARLVTQTRQTTDPAREIDAIDPAVVALVEKNLNLPPSDPGTAEIVTDEPGVIVLRTTCASRQMLVVSERIHPGWTLTLDGEAAPIEPAYGDFLGAVVESGTHEVAFRFAPQDYRTGLRMTLAAAGLALLWIVGAFLCCKQEG